MSRQNSRIMKSTVSLGLFLSAAFAAACTTQTDVKITFYGYPDNDPPSANIAYDCGRGYSAGGDGTHNNPLSMASAPGEYNKCEVVYFPYLQKYVRFEDYCAQCTSDWSSGLAHIDLWIGPTATNGGQSVITCENTLTPNQGQAVIRNPASDLPVNSGELWSKGKCHTENIYTNQDPSKFCSGGSNGGDGGGDGGDGGDGDCSWPDHCTGATCSDENDCADDLICNNDVCGKDHSDGDNGSCSWPGHCEGASCSDEDDCSDDLICRKGKCGHL